MGDDAYKKKIALWVERPVVFRPPKAKGWIPFSPRKFSSYEEFHRWKRDYRARLAAAGGLQWTR